MDVRIGTPMSEGRQDSVPTEAASHAHLGGAEPLSSSDSGAISDDSENKRSPFLGSGESHGDGAEDHLSEAEERNPDQHRSSHVEEDPRQRKSNEKSYGRHDYLMHAMDLDRNEVSQRSVSSEKAAPEPMDFDDHHPDRLPSDTNGADHHEMDDDHIPSDSKPVLRQEAMHFKPVEVNRDNFVPLYGNFLKLYHFQNPAARHCRLTEHLAKFDTPPKNQKRTFDTYDFFEVVREIGGVEKIKSWSEVARRLGFDPRGTNIAARVKDWMVYHHIGAYFDYLLGIPNEFFMHERSEVDEAMLMAPMAGTKRQDWPDDHESAQEEVQPKKRGKKSASHRRTLGSTNSSVQGDQPGAKWRHSAPSGYLGNTGSDVEELRSTPNSVEHSHSRNVRGRPRTKTSKHKSQKALSRSGSASSSVSSRSSRSRSSSESGSEGHHHGEHYRGNGDGEQGVPHASHYSRGDLTTEHAQRRIYSQPTSHVMLRDNAAVHEYQHRYNGYPQQHPSEMLPPHLRGDRFDYQYPMEGPLGSYLGPLDHRPPAGAAHSGGHQPYMRMERGGYASPNPGLQASGSAQDEAQGTSGPQPALPPPQLSPANLNKDAGAPVSSLSTPVTTKAAPLDGATPPVTSLPTSVTTSPNNNDHLSNHLHTLTHLLSTQPTLQALQYDNTKLQNRASHLEERNQFLESKCKELAELLRASNDMVRSMREELGEGRGILDKAGRIKEMLRSLVDELPTTPNSAIPSRGSHHLGPSGSGR
ncbi:hypothetical protein DFJ77DRAFT_295177 [Powellomyces hirtus]|nr:hypothetical protein DFJ77DRAFT_295177 [Powellomyces hirtus]